MKSRFFSGHKAKPASKDHVVTMVTRLRARNNKSWMSLVRLSLSLRPKKAKAILRNILETDEEINRWWARL